MTLSGKIFVLGKARTYKGYSVYKITNLVNGKFYIGKCHRHISYCVDKPSRTFKNKNFVSHVG